ncbi:MAG: GGDEF domain-containing protein [Beijerinckiaceae bacterium]
MKRKEKRKAKVFWRILALTAISVAGSTTIFMLIARAVFGSNPDMTITVGDFWTLGLFISIFVPMLLCPVVTYRLSRLIQELQIARDQLEILAQTDQLTGLLNRRGFDATADTALETALLPDRPVAVLVCDIDHFKQLNDSFGHSFGDQTLKHVAEILLSFAQSRSFIVGRQGGDEFVMMLPGVYLTEAAAIAESIRIACARTAFDGDTIGASLSVSIGVAASRGSQASLSALMRRADIALYDVKRTGRNRVVSVDVNEQWSSATAAPLAPTCRSAA